MQYCRERERKKKHSTFNTQHSIFKEYSGLNFVIFKVRAYIKIEASCLTSTASQERVKEMIQELAKLADHFELKLTGKDIH